MTQKKEQKLPKKNKNKCRFICSIYKEKDRECKRASRKKVLSPLEAEKQRKSSIAQVKEKSSCNRNSSPCSWSQWYHICIQISSSFREGSAQTHSSSSSQFEWLERIGRKSASWWIEMAFELIIDSYLKNTQIRKHWCWSVWVGRIWERSGEKESGTASSRQRESITTKCSIFPFQQFKQ